MILYGQKTSYVIGILTIVRMHMGQLSNTNKEGYDYNNTQGALVEKTYDFNGIVELTRTEMDIIVERAALTGMQVNYVAEKFLKSKYPDLDIRDKGALAFEIQTEWAKENNLTNFNMSEIQRKYIEENGIDEAAIKTKDVEWNNRLNELKNGIPTTPNPKNFTEPPKKSSKNLKKLSIERSNNPDVPIISVRKNNKTSTFIRIAPSLIRGSLMVTSTILSAKNAIENGIDKIVEFDKEFNNKLEKFRSNVIKSAKKLGADVAESSANLFQKALGGIQNFYKASSDAITSTQDKIADFLAPKIIEAENIAQFFPEALKETHEEIVDALGNAMFNAYDKTTKALSNWLYDDEIDSDVEELAKIQAELDSMPNRFAANAKIGIKSILDNKSVPNHQDEWNAHWNKFYTDMTDEELIKLYNDALSSGNKAMLDYYYKIADQDYARHMRIMAKTSGTYSGSVQSSATNKANSEAEVSSSMNNEILKAISKYLPARYRNVEYLPSIPHDILKSACDKMEYELKNNDQYNLSTEDRERILNIMWLSSGLGGYHNQLQTFMTSLNRFGGLNVTPSTEHVGLTFITRPRLCLQSSNIRNNRILTTLDTLNNRTMAFAIRNLLDSNFGFANNGLYGKQVYSSPIFDVQNPFLVPLCNALISFSGSPDIDLESTTTDGGYMSEAQSFAIGGSNLQRGNYNLTLNFQEVAHNPVMAILYYWIEYIRCVTRGSLLAYADDIDNQRLNYTVSIYRFLLDPTHRYITKYAKYTGCYPTGLPIGSAFNFSQGDVEVQASKQLSITFNCNKVEYMDYAILMDFNTLMRRYCPIINKGTKRELRTRQIPHYYTRKEYRTSYYYDRADSSWRRHTYQVEVQHTWYESRQYVEYTDVEYVPTDDNGAPNEGYALKCPTLPIEALANFRGLPYIVSDRNGFRLEFRQHPSPAFDNQTTTLADQLLYLDMMTRLSKEVSNYDTITSLYTPDYYDKAKGYSGVDLGEFIRRAFNNKASSDNNNAIY